ncbi:bifunctional adenosylcobinamide kinase/adenosylcobinamide-phosphate guanylyltransferase [Allobranchiibius sp. CTAmp26]|uniref:bifunctional adenosylcobinamide kinase/adenosylcobinamide-phosphate guanylyltransferase n=1 Tax=Allobranchiibius sp. CTAmp26 TaxID=2815214 RepID=UPI001AA0FED4|nr:bifunctional adenosylcobinamide kinase/adenosylcobinamide-phosphate guanylyltransferase [Allobranchiibius sp. CTAmp26]MBO1756776.1 bifunctional adenosylcobinamide kinase/adenosylcobinamide-phosphate guanylyltransferase [Allobranchiibius sp. CTAmp26]
MKTLVLGGIRSGKSAVAERTLADAPAVSYVATGPGPDLDDDWARRVHTHRERRPAHWSTIESIDLAGVLADLPGPALVDGLGTWITAHLDRLRAWEAPREDWEPAALELVDDLATTVRGCRHDLVIVSDEVGLSLVPEHRSARIFADLLGLTNQRVADACDTVQLVVAGQVLTVKSP